jgi:SAM-dependent methyltransferase
MKNQNTQVYWDTVFSQLQPCDPAQPLPVPALNDALAWLVEQQPAVLDFGCGTGRALLHAVHLGAKEGTGIDLSPQGIDLACRAALQAGLDGRVRFLAGGIERLQALPDASFGAGILFNIVDNMLPEHTRTLSAEFSRILVPGSRLLVKTNQHFAPADLESEPGFERIAEGVYAEPSGLVLWNAADNDIAALFSAQMDIIRKVDVELASSGVSNRMWYLEKCE